jgi:general secretion pathway protein G
MVATTILSILTMMALPLARITVQRQKERQLRHALWEIRDAIDSYKEAADRAAFQTKVDSFGYPPTLEDLVKGVDVQGKKQRFLRRIPIDPMTGTTEWGMRSMQDDVDSDSWGGQAVFDVYTKSESARSHFRHSLAGSHEPQTPSTCRPRHLSRPTANSIISPVANFAQLQRLQNL